MPPAPLGWYSNHLINYLAASTFNRNAMASYDIAILAISQPIKSDFDGVKSKVDQVS